MLLTCVLNFATLLSAGAEESEIYNRVLDQLTSVSHFADRPILFIVGFDTSKSMSVEFDRSKKLTQTILSRYGAPGDSIYIFGFADKPSVLDATKEPQILSRETVDNQLASLNESLLSLPRSSAKGTVFGRAKLFALEQVQSLGQERNVIVLLFSDNNSEIEMGTNERERLKSLESQAVQKSQTIPLYSKGVSPLWLTMYANSFPDSSPLAGPDGEMDLSSARLAWAARRVGSQKLQFVTPAGDQVSGDTVDVKVQFLGTSKPVSATLTIDGNEKKDTSFKDGQATWTITSLEPGPHLIFVQAELSDGKVRSAEKEIFVSRGMLPAPQTPVSSTPAPPPPVAKEPAPKAETGPSFPFIPLIILGVLGLVGYFLSAKPVKVRIIGPNREESFLIPKGKSLRLGGAPRVDSDLVFESDELKETVAVVKCQAFGKAKLFPSGTLREGDIEIETDEGYSVAESGEILQTTATATFSDERDRKQVFTFIKEEASGSNAEDSGHFSGGSTSGEEGSDGGGDWRS